MKDFLIGAGIGFMIGAIMVKSKLPGGGSYAFR